MTEPILSAQGLRKSFGALVATDDVSLDLHPGECHALIGPNGAGKTTLVHQLSGVILPDAGTIAFDGRDVTSAAPHTRAEAGLARSFQITQLPPSFTAREITALAAQARDGSSFRFFRPASLERALNERAMAALEAVGLQDRAHAPSAALSHGERRALELAVALAAEPKALLLDEPMAGMGHEEGARLTEMLQGVKRRIPVLLIEHDMDAVFALAERISVLVYGRILASGPPDAIRSDAAVRTAYLGEEDADDAASADPAAVTP